MLDHVGKQEHKVFPEEKASLFIKKTRRKKTERKTTNSKSVLLIENNNKGGELEMGRR